jgi:hypothetical protein
LTLSNTSSFLTWSVLGLLFIKYEDRISQHLGIVCLCVYCCMFRPSCRPSSDSLQNHINKGWPTERPVLYKQFICSTYKNTKLQLIKVNAAIWFNKMCKTVSFCTVHLYTHKTGLD